MKTKFANIESEFSVKSAAGKYRRGCELYFHNTVYKVGDIKLLNENTIPKKSSEPCLCLLLSSEYGKLCRGTEAWPSESAWKDPDSLKDREIELKWVEQCL